MPLSKLFSFFTLFWWNLVRWRIKHIFWVRKSLIFAFTTLRWSGPKSWAMVILCGFCNSWFCVCTMIFRMTRPFYDLSQFELEESSSRNKKIQNLQVKFLLDLNPRLESQKAYSCENSSGATTRFWYYGQHLSKMN